MSHETKAEGRLVEVDWRGASLASLVSLHLVRLVKGSLIDARHIHTVEPRGGGGGRRKHSKCERGSDAAC